MKLGERAYDLGTFGMRGTHEIANALYPESQIPLRDHSGLYQQQDVQPAAIEPEPEIELEDPDLEM